MKIFLYAIAIVVFSVVMVFLRHTDGVPNWVFWVMSFVFVAVLGWIRGIGSNKEEQ